MRRSLDPQELVQRLRHQLAARAFSGTELAARLGVSQPTVSRLIRQMQAELLTVGRGRATRHHLRRFVADVGSPVPIYEIDEDARARRIAWLYPVLDRGFHVESLCSEVESRTYDDWPWFLHALRPGGFLGRRITTDSAWGFPEEPRQWSADQLLRYLNHHGSNGSGAHVVGEPALQQWLAQVEQVRCEEDPSLLYPQLVQDVFLASLPGSSAEGEQPKFLLARSASRPELLVKFSPTVESEEGRRVADLLLMEHHALQTLASVGVDAASSSIVEEGSRVFLETERFDRTPAGGRLGLLSLEAFDLQFVGDGRRNSWPQIVERLIEQKVMPADVRERVAQLHAFGHLIGNTDMHTGNLSFRVRGESVLSVAPAYDMAPMWFSPLRGELPQRELRLSLGTEVRRSIWLNAIDWSAACWAQVIKDCRVSPGFRRIAAECARRVEAARATALRLPD